MCVCAARCTSTPSALLMPRTHRAQPLVLIKLLGGALGLGLGHQALQHDAGAPHGAPEDALPLRAPAPQAHRGSCHAQAPSRHVVSMH